LLNDYLETPKHLAPHGKMSFAGVKNEGQRADILAYLKQFDAREIGNDLRATAGTLDID
jgi:cytochrome c2